MNSVRATNRLRSGFRKSVMPDLTFLNQILQRSGHIFDRHVRVHAMLIEEIDAVGLQSPERRFGYLLHVLWPAVDTNLLSLETDGEAELGSNHNLVADRCEGFPDKFFVGKRAVHFSSVK